MNPHMRPVIQRWRILWGVTMAFALVPAAIYVRANTPPQPGVYWLFPYPSSETPTELQKRAEASPAYQAALTESRAERRALVMRAGAAWILSGIALYALGSLVSRRRRIA